MDGRSCLRYYSLLIVGLLKVGQLKDISMVTTTITTIDTIELLPHSNSKETHAHEKTLFLSTFKWFACWIILHNLSVTVYNNLFLIINSNYQCLFVCVSMVVKKPWMFWLLLSAWFVSLTFVLISIISTRFCSDIRR